MTERLLLCLVLCGCSCEDTDPPSPDVVETDSAGTDVSENDADEATDADSEGDLVLASPATLTFDGAAEASVQAIALSPDGGRAVASGWDGRIVVFDLDSGDATEIAEFGTGSLVMEDAMAWAGERIAVGRFEGLVLFDESGTEVATLDGRTSSVIAAGDDFIRVSRDAVERIDASGAVSATTPVVGGIDAVLAGSEVFVLREAEAEYTVAVYDATTLAEGRTLSIDARALYGSSEGVLAGTVLDTTTLYSTDGSTLRTLAYDTIEDDPVGLSMVGPWTAVLGFAQGVALFDTATGALLGRAAGATGRGIALDGTRRIVAGGAGGLLVYSITRE
ncbi:MAG: hypothetical protein AB8H86_01700 [Polyangiales bacterium]